MSFEVVPLDGTIGAEIVGLDLDAPIEQSTRRALYDVWVDAGILLFRQLGTSTARHLALSRCFGTLEVHPAKDLRLPDHPEIISLGNTGDTEPIVHYFDGEPIADRSAWHTDTIFTPAPCRGGLLRMVRKSEEGGETGWIDTAAAYDALSEDMKRRIEDLEARFDFTDERFTLVHDWEVGDMVLWDNWRTMHRALGIPPHCEREVQRTTIDSERVIGRFA